jgi:maltose-binding protein MalE
MLGCGPSEDGPVRIRIWHQKDTIERTLLENIITRYNAEQTDHSIEVVFKETEELRSSYIIAASGGQGPEIVFGPADNIGLFEITQTIMPLDTVFDAAFFDQFTNDGLVRWKDQTWLIGDQVGNHLILVYNTELVETPPETMEELIQIGQQLTVDEDGDGRPEQYGLTWNYTEPFFFIPFLTGYGGWVLDEDGKPTLDTENTVKAIELVLALRDQYGIIPKETDYETAQTLFKEGRSGMIINGPWAWAGYGEAGIHYGLAPLPLISETGRYCAPMTASKGYSININVEPEIMPYVKRVITFLTSAEVQVEMADFLATIPVNKEALKRPQVINNALLQASLKQVELGRPMPILPQLRQVWDGMKGPYQLVMNGAVSAEEGARLMQEKVEKLIADTFL